MSCIKVQSNAQNPIFKSIKRFSYSNLIVKRGNFPLFSCGGNCYFYLVLIT